MEVYLTPNLIVNMLSIVYALFVYVLPAATDDNTEIRNPFGLRMCEGICAQFGECQNALYETLHLVCYLTNSSHVPDARGILLHVEKNSPTKQFYRVITTKSKNIIFIQNRKRTQTLEPRMPRGFVAVRAGGDTIVAKRHEEAATYSAARDVCRAEGGDLVKIDTKKKHAAIKAKFIRKSEDISTNFRMWIGLTRENNVLRWADGSIVNYTNWFFGSKRNEDSAGQTTDKRCVYIATLIIWSTHWKEGDCSDKNGFICETGDSFHLKNPVV